MNKHKQKLKSILKEMSTYLPLDPSSKLALPNYTPNSQTQIGGTVFHSPDIASFTVK